MLMGSTAWRAQIRKQGSLKEEAKILHAVNALSVAC